MDDAGALPFDGSPFRLTVGVRRVAPDEWIEHDPDVVAQLRERERVLGAHHDEAVRHDATPRTRAACEELLAAVVDAVRDRDPAIWRVTPQEVEIVPTGVRVALGARSAHPVERVAHLVADDLCVLAGDPPLLVAGAVCFPNRWRLRDKIGRPLGAVHGPVPGYEAELAARVDRVVERLVPGAPLERRNWSLLADQELHQPVERPCAVDVTVADAGHRLWVRVERQTLLRLPRTGAVVFSIRTHQRRLDSLDATQRANLAASLATLPGAMAAYKGLTDLAAVALHWARRG